MADIETVRLFVPAEEAVLERDGVGIYGRPRAPIALELDDFDDDADHLRDVAVVVRGLILADVLHDQSVETFADVVDIDGLPEPVPPVKPALLRFGGE